MKQIYILLYVLKM